MSEPFGVRLELTDPEPFVPPGVVAAELSWASDARVDVLEAYAFVELRLRCELLSGARRSTVEHRVVLLPEGDFVPDHPAHPGDLAYRLPLPSSLAAGDAGGMPLRLPVDVGHPSVSTPALELAHSLVVRLHPLEGAPVEARRPVALLVDEEGYAPLEQSDPSTGGAPGAVALDVPVRRCPTGGVVAGSVELGTGVRAARVSLRRAAVLHGLANPAAGPVGRDDEVVDEVMIDDVESGLVGFSLAMPTGAPPTCITRWGSVRWFVRAEAGGGGRGEAPSFVEVELNVHNA